MNESGIAVLALATALLVAGCGSSGDEDRTGSANAAASTSTPQGPGIRPGTYRVGPDIAPGVYTAAGPNCLASSAATAEFELGRGGDEDDFLAAPSLVRDVQRIAVRRREFLTIRSCTWHREVPDGPHTPDPATLEGACQILLGDGFAEDAVTAVGKLESDYLLQERLMAVVYGFTPKVWEPAGQLVDFLDDPKWFVDADGRVEPKVIAAVDDIRRACRTVAVH